MTDWNWNNVSECFLFSFRSLTKFLHVMMFLFVLKIDLKKSSKWWIVFHDADFLGTIIFIFLTIGIFWTLRIFFVILWHKNFFIFSLLVLFFFAILNPQNFLTLHVKMLKLPCTSFLPKNIKPSLLILLIIQDQLHC